METSTHSQSLMSSDGQEKLSYMSIVNAEPVQQPLKKVENNTRTDSCLYNDPYDDDEGKQKLRKRNPENWKQNVRKRNKNKGNIISDITLQSYFTYNLKI